MSLSPSLHVSYVISLIQSALKDAFAPVARLESLKQKPFLKPNEVEELYGIPESSLKALRSRKKGPRFYQPSQKGCVFYEHQAIISYIQNDGA